MDVNEIRVALVPPFACSACRAVNERDGWKVESQKIERRDEGQVVSWHPKVVLGPFSRTTAELLYAKMILDGAIPVTGDGGWM